MSTLQRLTDRGLIKPPRWLPGNVQYETTMGSVAYGVSSDSSDVDVYGWAIPPKDDPFPHLRGPSRQEMIRDPWNGSQERVSRKPVVEDRID